MEYIIDNKKSITIEDLSTNNIIPCKDIISLKEFLLDSVLLNPIILCTDNLYVDKNTGEKSRVFEYATNDTKITFKESVFVEYPNLYNSLNIKKMKDMFMKTRSEINNGNNSIYIEISSYNDRKNVSSITKDDVFKYSLFENKDGSISEDDLVYLNKLVDIYLNKNGISKKYRELANLGRIYSDERSFVGSGEPIESIISRKVLKYERKSNNGRIS